MFNSRLKLILLLNLLTPQYIFAGPSENLMKWWYGKVAIDAGWQKKTIAFEPQATQMMIVTEWHLKELGLEDLVTSNPPLPRYKVSYQPALVDYKVDEAALNELRELFSQQGSQLFPDDETPVIFPPLIEAVKTLRANQFLLQSFLRLAPLIYGTALNQEKIVLLKVLRVKIEQSNLIQDTVLDIFHNHVYPQVKKWAHEEKDEFVLTALNKFVKNRFYEEKIIPRLKYKAIMIPPGEAISELFLEEVHPLIAEFRAEWTGDCSLDSVPLHVLSPDVKVYHIRKFDDFETKPVGYVLVLNVKLNGKTLPYIVTMNGGLSSAEVRGLSLSIAKMYGADQFITPNFKKNIWLANNDRMRFGMNSFRMTPVRVEIPESFKKISELRGLYAEYLGYFQHQDYYHPERIANANLVTVSEQENPQTEVVELGRFVRYKPTEKPNLKPIENHREKIIHAAPPIDPRRFLHSDVWRGRVMSFTQPIIEDVYIDIDTNINITADEFFRHDVGGGTSYNRGVMEAINTLALPANRFDHFIIASDNAGALEMRSFEGQVKMLTEKAITLEQLIDIKNPKKCEGLVSGENPASKPINRSSP